MRRSSSLSCSEGNAREAFKVLRGTDSYLRILISTLGFSDEAHQGSRVEDFGFKD